MCIAHTFTQSYCVKSKIILFSQNNKICIYIYSNIFCFAVSCLTAVSFIGRFLKKNVKIKLLNLAQGNIYWKEKWNTYVVSVEMYKNDMKKISFDISFIRVLHNRPCKCIIYTCYFYVRVYDMCDTCVS